MNFGRVLESWSLQFRRPTQVNPYAHCRRRSRQTSPHLSGRTGSGVTIMGLTTNGAHE